MMDEICAHIADLVVNSISAGAKHIKVSIEKSNVKNELFVKVSDDGKGMDESTLKHVIDPFFQQRQAERSAWAYPF